MTTTNTVVQASINGAHPAQPGYAMAHGDDDGTIHLSFVAIAIVATHIMLLRHPTLSRGMTIIKQIDNMEDQQS